MQIIPICGSPYSLRLWPGSYTRREYCLDFVYSNDVSTSLNVPQGYRLVSRAPMGETPWLDLGSFEVYSAEHNWAIKKKDLRAGSEKYVLRDGLHCYLIYPTEAGPEGGKMWFRVPIRSSGASQEAE